VLAGGIIFAATRGDEKEELTQIDPSKETQTVNVEKSKDEDGKQKDDQPAPVQTAVPVDGEPGQVKETETATLGPFEKAIVFIKSKSIPVQIAMGVGVVVLLAALGLTIWQVVEISLGNESILDLVSGWAEGHPGTAEHTEDNGTGTTGSSTQTTTQKEDHLALRNNRLKATSLATAGSLCLGIGVPLGVVGVVLAAAEKKFKVLISGLIFLALGVVATVLAGVLGHQWFGANPNHLSYLAIGTGLFVGALILTAVDEKHNLSDANLGKLRIAFMVLGFVSALLVALFSFVLPYFSTADNCLNAFNV
jgi:hypothetical protein